MTPEQVRKFKDRAVNLFDCPPSKFLLPDRPPFSPAPMISWAGDQLQLNSGHKIQHVLSDQSPYYEYPNQESAVRYEKKGTSPPSYQYHAVCQSVPSTYQYDALHNHRRTHRLFSPNTPFQHQASPINYNYSPPTPSSTDTSTQLYG